MAELLFALWIVLGLLVCPGVQSAFWAVVATCLADRDTLTARNRRLLRALRRLLWPAYGMWAGTTIVANTTMSAFGRIAIVAVFGGLNWLFWKLSKRLDDDDDWLKKLVEKGQGVVERIGNRLAVAAPAPAGGAA